MIGFPPTTVREALASLLFRLGASAVALWLAASAWFAPAPGVPKESNYLLVLAGVALFFWCASALWTLLRIAARPSATEVSRSNGD